jgi:hypothetical protein
MYKPFKTELESGYCKRDKCIAFCYTCEELKNFHRSFNCESRCKYWEKNQMERTKPIKKEQLVYVRRDIKYKG